MLLSEHLLSLIHVMEWNIWTTWGYGYGMQNSPPFGKYKTANLHKNASIKFHLKTILFQRQAFPSRKCNALYISIYNIFYTLKRAGNYRLVEIFSDFGLVFSNFTFFSMHCGGNGHQTPVARISFPGMKNGMKKSFFENIIDPLELESEWKMVPTWLCKRVEGAGRQGSRLWLWMVDLNVLGAP